MIGRTNAIGGGDISKAFAVIAVIYPENATCVCSNGTITLKSGNKTGMWYFGVPSAGTWVLTVSDGVKTVIKSVVVEEQNKIISVVVAFELVLYTNGDMRTDITGGWLQTPMGPNTTYPTFKKEATVSNTSSGLAITLPTDSYAGNGVGGAMIHTYNMIDLTDYSTATITFSNGTIPSNNQRFFKVKSRLDTAATEDAPTTADLASGSPLQMDISAVQGKHYIGLYLYCGGTMGVTLHSLTLS